VGAAMGLLVLVLAATDLRWLIFVALGICTAVVLLYAEHRGSWLWAIFILSAQVYVSFRFFHGRADSVGLEFPLVVITGLAVAAWQLASGEEPRARPLRLGGPLATPIGILFGAIALSLIFTTERFVGFTSLLHHLEYYALYLVTLNFAVSRERVQSTVWFLGITLVLQSLVYLVQAQLGVTFSLVGEVFGGRGVRAGGTVGANSGAYAAFILPPLMIVAAGVLSKHGNAARRLGFAIPLFLGFVTMVLTLRRGAWSGLVLAFVWLLWMGNRRKLFSRALVVSSALAVLIALIATPWLIAVVDALRPDNQISDAYSERLNLMRIALEVIRANPITGVGSGAYAHVYKDYLTPELDVGWIAPVHNYYLMWAAETGIPGLLGYLMLLGGGIRLSVRASRHLEPALQVVALGAGAGIVGYAGAVFWEPLSSFAPNALLWMLLGLLGAIHSSPRHSSA